MMMRMLEAAGLDIFSDGIRRADEDNPKGYFELERVKALARGDHDWLDEAQGRVVKVVSPLLRHLPEDQEYRVILMRRNMDEVLASQNRMLTHRSEPSRITDDEKLARLFEEDLRQVERWVESQPNVDCLQVSYNQMVTDPSSEVLRVVEFLGKSADPEALAGIVDPDLYRQRRE